MPFTEILLRGLAPDGGLYMPTEYPQVDQKTLNRWKTLFYQYGYAELAWEVMSLFIDDIPADDLRKLCTRAYSKQAFGSKLVAPTQKMSNGTWLLHLSNGPTAAFKDMAMQMLGQLFEYVLKREGKQLNILGATSGDTGSSAEYAMLGKDNIRVFMLTPAGRMTPFQQAQMFGIDDPRIINLAVKGVFDDCQDIVKAISADAVFKEKYAIGAVNSINWARLLAQVVYYVAAWIQISEETQKPVSFVVPTGNFGDICAGHIAKQMGIPIGELVVATNENDVLHEFFTTGVYRTRSAAQTLATSSPSMDISKASNFERFIFDLLGRDQDRVGNLFGDQLVSTGSFDLSNAAEFRQIRSRYGFSSGSSTHQNRLAAIKAVYESDRYIIDPHTADAWQVATQMQAKGQLTGPTVVLETALPVKFSQTIQEALGIDPPLPQRFAQIMAAGRKVTVVENSFLAVKDIIRTTVQHADPDGSYESAQSMPPAAANAASGTGQPGDLSIADPDIWPEEVNGHQAKALVEQGAKLLDVREETEWSKGHLQSARLVPLGKILAEETQSLDPLLPYVVYCAGGVRSLKAVRALRASGFKATSLQQGITAWPA